MISLDIGEVSFTFRKLLEKKEKMAVMGLLVT